jgi:hypothetical protein
MCAGAKEIRVVDVRYVAAIKFVSEFAAKRQLLMTYDDGGFLLTPRER